MKSTRTPRRGRISQRQLGAAVLVVALAGAEAKAGPSCAALITARCLDFVGAGAMPADAPTDCVSQRRAYRDCLAEAVLNAGTGGPSAGAAAARGGCSEARAARMWAFVEKNYDCVSFQSFRDACPSAPEAILAAGALKRLGCGAKATTPATTPPGAASDADSAPRGPARPSDAPDRVKASSRRGDWSAFADLSGAPPVCFAATNLMKSNVLDLSGESSQLLVSTFPAQEVRGEVSVRFAVAVDAAKPISLAVTDADGARRTFKLLSQGRTAWLADVGQTNRVAAALQAGSTAIVEAVLPSGTSLRNTYSLRGADAMIAQAAVLCR